MGLCGKRTGRAAVGSMMAWGGGLGRWPIPRAAASKGESKRNKEQLLPVAKASVCIFGDEVLGSGRVGHFVFESSYFAFANGEAN